MKYSNDEYELLNRLYKINYEKEKELSKSFKTELLQLEEGLEAKLAELNSKWDIELDPSVFRAAKLLSIHKALLFFPDKEILERFAKYYGCSFEEINKFFVSYEDLNKCFEEIEKTGIHIDKVEAILMIKGYLAFKFSMGYVQQSYQVTRDKVKMSSLSNELIKLKKRRENSKSNQKLNKNSFKEFLNQLATLGESMNKGEKGDWKISLGLDNIIKISRANTEKIFIKQMVLDCFEYKHLKMKKSKFRSTIYDLLRLILTKDWISEDQFDEIQDVSYKSWEWYRAKKVRVLLQPLKKK